MQPTGKPPLPTSSVLQQPWWPPVPTVHLQASTAWPALTDTPVMLLLHCPSQPPASIYFYFSKSSIMLPQSALRGFPPSPRSPSPRRPPPGTTARLLSSFLRPVACFIISDQERGLPELPHQGLATSSPHTSEKKTAKRRQEEKENSKHPVIISTLEKGEVPCRSVSANSLTTASSLSVLSSLNFALHFYYYVIIFIAATHYYCD